MTSTPRIADLNKSWIDENLAKLKAEAFAAGDRITVWDNTLKGFGLRVSPKGTISYVVRYRVGGGRSGTLRQMVVGRGVQPIGKVRADAKTALAQVETGGDPQGAKVADRGEVTVTALCDLYLAEGCATKKASTTYTDKGRIERHIKPLLGSKRVGEVASADIEKFMQGVAAGKTAGQHKGKKRGVARVTGGQGAATRAVGLLGAIFTFAKARGLVEINPVRGVKRYKDKNSERFLDSDEMKRLGQALEGAADGLNSKGLAVIRLLALTGCRKREIEALRWAEVDSQRGYLRLRDSKTGAKVVPVGASAIQTIAEQPRGKSEFVFPAERSDNSHYMGTPKVWADIKSRAALPGVRLHDLRHGFASMGAGDGQSLQVLGKILGHKSAKTTSRYAHLSDDPVRRAADRISEMASNALDGKV